MPNKLYLLEAPKPHFEKLAVNDRHLGMFYVHHGLPPSDSAKLFEAEISWRANYLKMSQILSDFEERMGQATLVPLDPKLTPYDECYRILDSIDLTTEAEAFIAGLLESTFSMVDRMGTATVTMNRNSSDRIWPGACLDANGGTPGNAIQLQNATRWNVINQSPQANTLTTVIKEWRHERTHAVHYYAFGAQMEGQQPDMYFTTARSPDDWAGNNTTFYLRNVLENMHEIQEFLVWWSDKVRLYLETELKHLELIP